MTDLCELSNILLSSWASERQTSVPLLIIGCLVIAQLWQKLQIVSPDEGVKSGLVWPSESVTRLVDSDCRRKKRKMNDYYLHMRPAGCRLLTGIRGIDVTSICIKRGPTDKAPWICGARCNKL